MVGDKYSVEGVTIAFVVSFIGATGSLLILMGLMTVLVEFDLFGGKALVEDLNATETANESQTKSDL